MPPSETPRPNSSGGIDRRAFCISATAAGMAVACGGGVARTAHPPPPSTLVTTRDTKAAILALQDGTTKDYRNQGSFFLIKDATGIYAMSAVCTHMGCTVSLPLGGQIHCPCHGRKFSLSGINLSGPATESLVHFLVVEPLPGSSLLVDTTQIVDASVRLI